MIIDPSYEDGRSRPRGELGTRIITILQLRIKSQAFVELIFWKIGDSQGELVRQLLLFIIGKQDL